MVNRKNFQYKSFNTALINHLASLTRDFRKHAKREASEHHKMVLADLPQSREGRRT